MTEKESSSEWATFGGGCFWCIEAIFQRLKGVKSVTSGYTGGKTPHPTYNEVCKGKTGHAEVVQITFDSAKISYEELLEVFWKSHDPTTLSRQGANVGKQYRSVIFYHNKAQKEAAEKSSKAVGASGMFPHPIVTEISPLTTFYPAEDYHQDYYNQNPHAGYCNFVIRPKLRKLGIG